jgi:hypothetical protein
MIILNKNDTSVKIKPDRYMERLKNYSTGNDVFTGEILNLSGEIPVPAKGSRIFELR